MSRPQLHLICDDPKVDLKVNMGDGPATPTAGFAGREVVPRNQRKGMTSFVGTEPFQQDVPVLLDGYRENRSVERALEQLLSLGGNAVFKAYGPIHREGIDYVFGEDPEFGTEPGKEVIRAQDGTLLRQALTLKLMEYVPATVIGHRHKMDIGQAVPVSYRTKQGDTLIKVAQAVYHDWRRWKEIGQKNGITDPHRVLPAGMPLTL